MKKTTYLIDTENVGNVWKSLLPNLHRRDRLLFFYTENSPGISYADLQQLLKSKRAYEFITCHTGKNGLDFQLISYLGFLLNWHQRDQFVVVSSDTGYDPALQFWRDKGYLVERISRSMLKEDPKLLSAGSAVVPVFKPLSLQKAEPTAPAAAPAAPSSVTESGLRHHSAVRRKKPARVRAAKPVVLPDVPAAEPVKPEMPKPAAKHPSSDGWQRAVDRLLPSLSETERQQITSILKRYTYRQKQEIHYELVKAFGEAAGVAHYRKLRPHLYDLYQSMK